MLDVAEPGLISPARGSLRLAPQVIHESRRRQAEPAAETAASGEVILAAIHCVVWNSVANLRMLALSDRSDFIRPMSEE
jgi:hypothetical protein